jgi:hypothetical protein
MYVTLKYIKHRLIICCWYFFLTSFFLTHDELMIQVNNYEGATNFSKVLLCSSLQILVIFIVINVTVIHIKM